MALMIKNRILHGVLFSVLNLNVTSYATSLNNFTTFDVNRPELSIILKDVQGKTIDKCWYGNSKLDSSCTLTLAIETQGTVEIQNNGMVSSTLRHIDKHELIHVLEVIPSSTPLCTKNLELGPNKSCYSSYIGSSIGNDSVKFIFYTAGNPKGHMTTVTVNINVFEG